MLDGRKRFNGRLGGLDADGRVVLETSFGRFDFAFDEIEAARIDPIEILAREGPRGTERPHEYNLTSRQSR